MKTAPLTMHVLTNAEGKIIGAAVLDPVVQREQDTYVRLSPLKGQRLAEIAMPKGTKDLKTPEDFARLCEEFHLPAGEKQLVPRGKERPSKKKPVRAKGVTKGAKR